MKGGNGNIGGSVCGMELVLREDTGGRDENRGGFCSKEKRKDNQNISIRKRALRVGKLAGGH